MTPVWPTIERFLAEHGAAVLVTLAESAGSSPREVGARMVVRPDGRFSGTIGGGALAWLVLAVAPLLFAVTGIDPRPACFPSHVPGDVICRTGTGPVRVLEPAPGGAFVAIMARSHALDLDVAAAALLARRFAYVGVIGSATKRARFTGALRQIGLTDDDIARLICPISPTEIHDNAPASLAAAVAAQLLIRRDAIAASTLSPEHAAQAPSDASHA